MQRRYPYFSPRPYPPPRYIGSGSHLWSVYKDRPLFDKTETGKREEKPDDTTEMIGIDGKPVTEDD